MSGIKECIRNCAAGAVIFSMVGLTSGAALHAQASSPASTSLPAPVLNALARSTSVSLQLPDGRTLQLENQYLVLTSLDGKARSFPLPTIRIGATTVVLPNGRVLVWGGTDPFGQLLADGEWFDPAIGQFSAATATGLAPITGQNMTVLSDGDVLVAGGWTAASGDVDVVTLWHPATNTSTALVGTSPARLAQTATLLRDGTVALSGGFDLRGAKVDDVQRFDPATGVLTKMGDVAPDLAKLTVVASMPVADSTDNTADTPISVRFSQPIDPRSVSVATVSLIGPAGPVDVTIAGVQNGRLAFVTPHLDLLTGSSYTLVLSGIRGTQGQRLPFTSIGFRTAALSAPASSASASRAADHASKDTNASASSSGIATAASKATVAGGLAKSFTLYRSTGSQGSALTNASCNTVTTTPHLCRQTSYIKDGAWYPGQNNAGIPGNGHWRLNLPDMSAIQIAADAVTRHEAVKRAQTLSARASISSSLSGELELIDGNPIAHVQVTLGKVSAYTDAQGRFTLNDVPSGRQSLYVDGTTANHTGYEYGQFVVGVDVLPGGITQMPYHMYLPRILDRDKIPLPSPTTQDMVITHPDIPGLEIHIPAGTVMRDHKGKVVTEFAIVPTPVDRAPFPVSENFPVYFSLEPGGATVQSINAKKPQGLTIVYPNYAHAPPGAEANFYVYEPKEGWRVYGKGRVTADGRQVEPEAGVNLVWVMGGSFGLSNAHPGDTNPTKECGPCAGDPVDLWSGTLQESQTDVHINDVMPIDVTRLWHDNAYLALDPRMFGGWRSNYDMYLYSGTGDFSKPNIRLPDGNVLVFSQIATRPGDTYTWHYTTGGASPWNGAVLETVSYNMRCGAIIECFLLTTRDGTQYQFTNGYYAPSQLTFIRDRFGNQVSLTWSAGLLQQVTSPSGRYVSFTYNADNSIASMADNTGRTWGYTYHKKAVVAGQNQFAYFLDTVTHPDTTTTQFTYDDDYTTPPSGQPATHVPGTLLTMTDRNGNVVMSNHYAADSSQISQQTLADGSTYQFQYVLSNGVPGETDVTDPLGHVRRVLFDPASGYPASETWGYGTSLAQTTTYVRDANGLMSSMTDALGRTTTFGYDANNNVTQVTALAGTSNAVSASFTWTPDYNQLASRTDALGHTTSFAYTSGCLTGVTDPLGHTTSIACNGSGQPVQITDALGHTSALAYQGNDLRGVTDALGRSLTFAVDSLGRLTSVSDPLGHTSLRQYNSNGWLTRSTDPLGQITELGYDNEGHIISVTLPSGAVLATTYTPRYWVSQRTDALGQSEHWTYDGLGNVLSTTDRKNQTTTYASRDALGRFVQVTYADGSTVMADTYDAGNRLVKLTDSVSGPITRSFDDLDHMTGESTPQGVVTYTYAPNGLRTSMVAAGQAPVTYTYDAADRLASLSQGSESVGFTYDNANRRATLTLPNGIVANYGYDAANELTGITYTTAANTTVGDLGYTYDTAGRRIGQTGTLASDVLPTVTSANSTFDLANRQAGFNGKTLSYDANGNLTGDGVSTYVWNARNQLAQIQQGVTTVASFSYDAAGRRIAKTASGVTTGYLYDGANAVQETQGTVINPILTGLHVDERFARNEGGTRSYFLTDALGSTVALANAGGSLIQQYQYDPYGNAATTPSTTNPYQYTGRENDGTGLYYYRARYYSPAMGRFISEDPIGFGGGQNNFYAYAGGSPLMYIDSNGKELLLAGIGAGIGGAFGLVQGIIAGHTGWELAADVGAGALTGGVAGLTNGMSLLVGIPLRAATGAAIEAGKQKLVDGCVHDYVGIGLAGAGSLLGDASEFGSKGAWSAASAGAEKYGSAITGDIFGGALPLPAAPSAPDR